MATATDDAPTHSPSEWLEAVVDAERRAELLSACDIADRGLDEHPGEPVTPPGAVFVTEPFAAALELAGSSFACDYVGHPHAAKQFGRLRMYRLRGPAAKRDSTCKSS